MRWWVTLGDFASDEGIISELSFESGRLDAREVLRHRPPQDRRVFGKGFTGAVFDRGSLLVCSFNGVHRVGSNGSIETVLERADFNDLHHVAIVENRWWISNTGLDRVDVFEPDGRFAGALALVPSEEEHVRRSPNGEDKGYFRQDPDLPLHQRRLKDCVHPNHVCSLGSHVIVTRFATRSLQRLGDLRVVVGETPGHPHDGIAAGDRFWITCTNGQVLEYEIDPRGTWKQRARLDLFSTTGRRGWCRGLWVGSEMLLIGLTRVTRPAQATWCDLPIDSTETAILAVDRETGKMIDALPIARAGAQLKIFSIIEVPR